MNPKMENDFRKLFESIDLSLKRIENDVSSPQEVQILSDHIKTLDSKVNALFSPLKEAIMLKGMLSSLRMENEKLRREAPPSDPILIKENKSLKKEFTILTEENEELSKELEDLMREKKKLEKKALDNNELIEQMKELVNQNEELQEKLKDQNKLEMQIESLYKVNDELTAQLESMHKNTACKSIMSKEILETKTRESMPSKKKEESQKIAGGSGYGTMVLGLTDPDENKNKNMKNAVDRLKKLYQNNIDD